MHANDEFYLRDEREASDFCDTLPRAGAAFSSPELLVLKRNEGSGDKNDGGGGF